MEKKAVIVWGVMAACFAAILSQGLPRPSSPEMVILHRAAIEMGLILILLGVPGLRSDLWRSIRFPRNPHELTGIFMLRWLGVALIALFAFEISGRITIGLLPEWLATLIKVKGEHTFMLIKEGPFLWITRLLSIPIAAIQEEMTFRAGIYFALTYLGVTRPGILLVSATAFAAAHYTSGVGAMVFAFLAGIALMSAFIQWRSTPPLIAGHAIYNCLVAF